MKNQSSFQQDSKIAQIPTEQQAPDTFPLAELESARYQFMADLWTLKNGEDPATHVKTFILAILPTLRMGTRLAGRKRVVNSLAKLLGKLIQKFVGPQNAHRLSRATVDEGLHPQQCTGTMAEASQDAAMAVAATVEDTVRRVTAAPEHILDDQKQFPEWALEAFKQAAAANLPAILSE
jgi:hypothetical protein